MASLALLVVIIFLTVLLSGPVSILFSYLKLKILSVVFALIAIISGINWLCVTPLPISLIGLLSILCGIYSIRKVFK
jgi:hypothetical protein